MSKPSVILIIVACLAILFLLFKDIDFTFENNSRDVTTQAEEVISGNEGNGPQRTTGVADQNYKQRRNVSYPLTDEDLNHSGSKNDPRIRQIRLHFLGSGYVAPQVMSQTLHTAQGLLYGLMTDMTYNCTQQTRCGSQGDGGYQVCVEEKYKPKSNQCLVYSFGINFHYAFDNQINDQFGCEVHSFDPSMGLADHVHREPNMFFHDLGIWGWDVKHPQQNWTLKSIGSIMKMLNHQERILDVLKVDAEGSEFPFMVDLIESGVYKRVRQLIIEFHVPRLRYQQHPPLSLVDYAEMYHTIHRLKEHGFESFTYWNINPMCCFFNRPHSLVPKSIAGEDKCCFEQNFVNVNLARTV